MAASDYVPSSSNTACTCWGVHRWVLLSYRLHHESWLKTASDAADERPLSTFASPEAVRLQTARTPLNVTKCQYADARRSYPSTTIAKVANRT